MHVYVVSFHDCTGSCCGLSDGLWFVGSSMEKAMAAIEQYIKQYHDVKVDEGGDGIVMRVIYCVKSVYTIEKVMVDEI